MQPVFDTIPEVAMIQFVHTVTTIIDDGENETVSEESTELLGLQCSMPMLPG